ncbi:proton-conducting membrane transporter [Maricaulis sp.]|uniref:proton-conducting membrane transporter n=1 Tax=Maricaulis sp. TaxID=1486257 RepID=UPI003A8D93F7
MFWLVWQIGFLILAAFGFGVLTGWKVWSGEARSAEADKALADVIALRRENENLARRLGEAETRAVAARQKPAGAVKTGHAEMPEGKVQPVPEKPAAAAKAKPAPTKPAATKSAQPKPAAAKPAVPKPAAPKPAAPATPAAPTDTGRQDDLTVIKGLGPKAAASLKAGGVVSLAQIAAWSEADIASWDERINGRGRIVRDDWVGQAKTLSA